MGKIFAWNTVEMWNSKASNMEQTREGDKVFKVEYS